MTALTRIVLTQTILRRLFRKGGRPAPERPPRVHCSRCNSDWKPSETRCPACGAPLDQSS